MNENVKKKPAKTDRAETELNTQMEKGRWYMTDLPP
jgi:hypothetical protein